MPSKLRSFAAGVLLANAIPHAATGIAGRRHMTPFGRDSSSLVNGLWSAANVAAACLLVSRDRPGPRQPQGWDVRLNALEAGAAVFSVWMMSSEYLLKPNTDRTTGA